VSRNCGKNVSPAALCFYPKKKGGAAATPREHFWGLPGAEKNEHVWPPKKVGKNAREKVVKGPKKSSYARENHTA